MPARTTRGTAGASARIDFVGVSDAFFPGSNVTDHWNGFDLGVNMRLAHGIVSQGGTTAPMTVSIIPSQTHTTTG